MAAVSRMVRRSVGFLLLGLLLAGAASRALERAGTYRCGCYPECWCKRPGLSLFRWLVPRFHTGPWNAQDNARHGALRQD
jgi:hypothetical protein